MVVWTDGEPDPPSRRLEPFDPNLIQCSKFGPERMAASAEASPRSTTWRDNKKYRIKGPDGWIYWKGGISDM